MRVTIQDVLDSRARALPKVQLATQVQDVVNVFSEKGVRATLVVDESDGICGIVSEHDVVEALSSQGLKAARLTMADVMSLDLIVVPPTTTAEEAMQMMAEHRVHHLPVVDESGHLLGFVDMTDVAATYIGMNL